MTIDEAIKIQTDYLNNPFLNFHPKFREAIQLGIEALKYHQWRRQLLGIDQVPLLPRETEE